MSSIGSIGKPDSTYSDSSASSPKSPKSTEVTPRTTPWHVTDFLARTAVSNSHPTRMVHEDAKDFGTIIHARVPVLTLPEEKVISGVAAAILGSAKK